MSFWDKNIEALNKTQPVLVKKLHEHKDDIPSSEAVHTIQAKDGNQALVLTVEGKDYVMNSRFRPIQEAVTYAEQFKDIKDYSVGIFFGFGNGMFAREIQKYGDMHVRYVYYEPSVESFLFGMHEYDWTDIWQKERTLIYVEGINEKDIRLDLSSWIDWSNMPLSEIYYLPKYQDIFPEIYKKYLQLVRDVFISAHLSNNTLKAYSYHFLRNSIWNLRRYFYASTPTAMIRCFPKELPAILVSAGPSLSKNIDVLKKAKGRALIISVDTALRKLFSEGIIPDIAVTVDPAKWFYKEEYDEYYKQVSLVADATSSVGVQLNMKPYRLFVINSNDEIAEYIFRKTKYGIPYMGTGGSVANTAFSLIDYIGIETIIMVGQDLALTGGKRYSDRDSDAYKEAIEKGFDLFNVEGYYGDTVKTRDDYLAYLKWFESAVGLSKMKNIINSTEGGAMIHGMVNMPLQEALDTYAKNEYDIKKIIDDIPYSFNDEQRKELDEYIHSMPSKASNFLRLFKEGKEITSRAITLLNRGNYDIKEYYRIQKRMKEIDKLVSNELEFIMINDAAAKVQRKVERALKTNADEALGNDLDVMKSINELYGAFYEAAKAMKQESTNMVKNLDEEGWVL